MYSFLVFLFCISIILVFIQNKHLSNNRYKKSNHYNGKVFFNISEDFKPKSFLDFLKWKITSIKVYTDISFNWETYKRCFESIVKFITKILKSLIKGIKKAIKEPIKIFKESKTFKGFVISLAKFIIESIREIHLSAFFLHVYNLVNIVFLSIKSLFAKFEYIENKNNDIPPAKIVDEDIYRLSFIGHSTFLLQLKGINIITDPVFSERSSPLSFFGPRRYRKPGIEFKNLPNIDLVLISHNHYDHMDMSTIRALYEKSNPLFLVPLGNAAIIKSHLPNAKITEMDWRDFIEYKDIKIHMIEARHWSSRFVFDENKALWGGFIVEKNDKQICFMCDTGYDKDLFEGIASRFNNIILSMIPIGAYKPHWIMSDSHITPEEAVKCHIDLKSKKSVAMHFGTFKLADETFDEQVEDLNIAKDKHKTNEFEILDFGSFTKGDF